MIRITLIIAVAAVLGTATGCRMCASPYDECGPVYSDGCGTSCDPNYRAGSILAGYSVTSMEDGMVLPSSPQPEVPLDLPQGAVILEDQTSSAGDPTPVPAPPAAPSLPKRPPSTSPPPVPGPARQ